MGPLVGSKDKRGKPDKIRRKDAQIDPNGEYGTKWEARRKAIKSVGLQGEV